MLFSKNRCWKIKVIIRVVNFSGQYTNRRCENSIFFNISTNPKASFWGLWVKRFLISEGGAWYRYYSHHTWLVLCLFVRPLLSLYSTISPHSPHSLCMHSSSSSSHSQSADATHCSPLFLLFSSLHLPPLSSHSVYSCQTLFSSSFIHLIFSSSHSVIQCGIVHLLIFSSFLSSLWPHLPNYHCCLSSSLSLSLRSFSPWAGRSDSRMVWLIFTFLFRHFAIPHMAFELWDKLQKLIKWSRVKRCFSSSWSALDIVDGFSVIGWVYFYWSISLFGFNVFLGNT